MTLTTLARNLLIAKRIDDMNGDASHKDVLHMGGNIEILLDYAEEQVSRAEKPARFSGFHADFPDALPGYSVVRRIKAGGLACWLSLEPVRRLLRNESPRHLHESVHGSWAFS